MMHAFKLLYISEELLELEGMDCFLFLHLVFTIIIIPWQILACF